MTTSGDPISNEELRNRLDKFGEQLDEVVKRIDRTETRLDNLATQNLAFARQILIAAVIVIVIAPAYELLKGFGVWVSRFFPH